MPAPDLSLPLPQATAAEAGTRDRLARMAAGIILAAPEHGDPPGTIARYAWPIPGQPWFACGTLAAGKSAQLEARTLQLVPIPGTDLPVSSELLRAISLTALTGAARAALTLAAGTEEAVAAELGTTPRPAAARLARIRQGGKGRPPLHPDLLRQTAETYLAEADSGPGLQDRMHDRLEELTGRSLTRAQVRNALRRAEEDGWITAGERGRGARRSPGPRLLAARGQEQAPLQPRGGQDSRRRHGRHRAGRLRRRPCPPRRTRHRLREPRAHHQGQGHAEASRHRGRRTGQGRDTKRGSAKYCPRGGQYFRTGTPSASPAAPCRVPPDTRRLHRNGNAAKALIEAAEFTAKIFANQFRDERA